MISRQRHTCDRATLLWTVALLVWACLMWGHSLMPGPVSDTESLAVVAFLRPVLEALGVSGTAAMNHVVRKAAHFTGYLVGGLIAAHAVEPRLTGRTQGVAASIAAGAGIACIDEVIQLFVPRRTGQPSDVVLDVCGVACGVAIVTLVRWVRERRRRGVGTGAS